jgi:hypothetical protein
MIASLATAYARYRDLAERALAQVEDDDLHTRVDADGNSLDVLVRHVGGNLRSRFTDFLTTDGEKPWRQRDGEFEERRATRDEMLAIWTTGWDTLEAVLALLTDDDLQREVTIRTRALTVEAALLRSYGHTAYHVGQIVQLARAHVGAEWGSLSVPRGESEAYNRRMGMGG